MKVLVVDVKNIVYRAFSLFFSADTRMKDSYLIQSLLNQIASFKESFDPDLIIAAFDSGYDYRRKIYPPYKQNRAHNKNKKLGYTKGNGYKAASNSKGLSKSEMQLQVFNEAAEKQIEVFKELCNYLSVYPLWYPGIEADDIIASVSFTFPEVVIVSEDSDLVQLVNKDVMVYHPIKNLWITYDTIEEYYDYKTGKDYLNAKMIIGDSGDNIPGINGMGKKRTLSLYTEIGGLSATDIEQNEEHLKSKKYYKSLLEKYKTIVRNRNKKLMDLKYFNKVVLEKKQPGFNEYLVDRMLEKDEKEKKQSLDEFLNDFYLYDLNSSLDKLL